MRFAGTWRRYSNSAMPQLASAATYHLRSARFRRCAYHAKVMKTLDAISSNAVRTTTVFMVYGDVGEMRNGDSGPVLDARRASPRTREETSTPARLHPGR